MLANRKQLPLKRWKIYRYNLPYFFVIHLHVFMSNNIAHIICIAPWDLRKERLCLIRHHVSRLADNHDVSLGHSFLVITCHEIGFRHAFKRYTHFGYRLKHVRYSIRVTNHTANISFLTLIGNQ